MKINFILVTALVGLSWTAVGQMGNFSDPIRLGSGVNTEAEETMPVFSKDSSVLYFSRLFDPNSTAGVNDQDIWFSNREGSDYGTAQKVAGINNKYNNAVVGLSQDGNSMYVLDSYLGKKDLVKGCAVSTLKGKTWGTPSHIDVPTLDIEGSFFGFHVDATETVMIISYTGPGTLGEEDLYVSTKADGAWSVPVHMGNVINTAGFDFSPFLSSTLDTLYFSSNGHGGEGDADIFYSIRQNGSWTDWSLPVNLGPKINSPKYDAFFTFSSTKAYWASNRDSDNSDIYYANILPPPPLNASAIGTDVTVYQGSDGKIDLTIEGGIPPYDIIWSNNDKNEDPQNLVKGTYTALVTDLIGQEVEVAVEINEPTPPIPKELFFDIKPIYFDLAKHHIRKDAKKELDKIVKIMNDNPTLEIELGSHTDCRATEQYNLALSDKRAKASAAYIREKITTPSRINGKGYGESQLKVNCQCDGDIITACTEDDHQLNRRTEFRVRRIGDPTYEDIATSTTPQTTSSEQVEKFGKAKRTENVGKTVKELPSGSKFRTDIIVTEEQLANIANGFYIVNEGESLYRVSVNSKVSLDDLRRINNLTNNNIRPGTKLLLK
jgi:outer membrane protein OmpA-like peptidoglycan-associated protein/LysM repeat protein